MGLAFDTARSADLLLERDDALATLSERPRRRPRGQWQRAPRRRRGGRRQDLARPLVLPRPRSAHRDPGGACDPLSTPRPLGPLLDVAEGARRARRISCGSARRRPTSSRRSHDVLAGTPTVLVLEDLHWADEATLDVLRLLARRVETLPVLVVGTYRDDELDRAHPVRVLLGDLATAGGGPSALRLDPLSADGRRRLAFGHAGRSGRAAPADRRQPVLRHRGARLGGSATVPRPCATPSSARAARTRPRRLSVARGGRARAAPRRAVARSRRWRASSSTGSTTASPRGSS